MVLLWVFQVNQDGWISIIGDLYLTIVLHVYEWIFSIINSQTLKPFHLLFSLITLQIWKWLWMTYVYMYNVFTQCTPLSTGAIQIVFLVVGQSEVIPPDCSTQLISPFSQQAYHVPELTVPRPHQSTEWACPRPPPSPTPRPLTAASNGIQWSPKPQARVQL